MLENEKIVEKISSEVVAKPYRRTFTVAQKQKILSELDLCTEPGEKGAILRREGLYTSTVRRWRQNLAAGKSSGEVKRGRKPSPARQKSVEIEKHKRQVARLTEELRQAKLIIEIQKKVAEMIEVTLPERSD